MRSGHWVYFTNPQTGTVHLVKFTAALIGHVVPICGIRKPGGNQGWIEGDETLSGVAATCRRCAYLASDPDYST